MPEPSGILLRVDAERLGTAMTDDVEAATETGRPGTAGPGLTARLRSVPIGVLVIAAFFGILGLGSVTAGLYMVVQERSIGLWAAVTGLLGGPLILYLAWHMLRLSRWSWLALMVLVWMLFLSSVVRFVVAPGLAVSQLGEVVLEVAIAYYLLRPRVLAAFGR